MTLRNNGYLLNAYYVSNSSYSPSANLDYGQKGSCFYCCFINGQNKTSWYIGNAQYLIQYRTWAEAQSNLRVLALSPTRSPS